MPLYSLPLDPMQGSTYATLTARFAPATIMPAMRRSWMSISLWQPWTQLKLILRLSRSNFLTRLGQMSLGKSLSSTRSAHASS